MKWLQNQFESNEKHFKSGGKLEKFYALYEMLYTIHFSLTNTTKKSAHVRDSLDTKRFMILVVIALTPCILFAIYNTGYQSQLASQMPLDFISVVLRGLLLFLPVLITTFVVGGLWEVLFAIVRKHEVNEGFLVTGMLLPLTLPATIPLWQVALGVSFGVVIGKEVFGGTGKNFLNPALTARAFMFFSYPAYMSGDAVWTFLSVAQDKVADTFSGATPLAVAFLAERGSSVTEALTSAGFTWNKLFLGNYAASMGETSVLACLIGAFILILTGVGSWRTMLACVVGLVGMSTLLNVLAGPESVAFLNLSAKWHLVMGGFAFGAVFMATDPVSSPDTHAAKWIYGILIGCLTVLIRTVNPAYPEGVMLAILLMNVFAPLIDHYVVARRLKKRIPNVL